MKGDIKMSLQIYSKKRSLQSYLFEKYLILRNTKKGFSTIENTSQFIEQGELKILDPTL